MENGQPILWSLYVYAPNKGAPIFFAIAYACSAVGHFWQCFQYKSLKMVGLHPFCATLFAFGYALREWSAYNYIYIPDQTTALIVDILSQVFIYICPPLLELANYHILGRIFYYVPHLAPLPPGQVRSIFGILMAIVEALNSLGVSLASNAQGHSQGLGKNLTIAALSIQLCLIAIFITMASTFHRRCVNRNIPRSRGAITTPMTILYISMLLILIRCIYRLVEHVGNSVLQINDLEALEALSPILRYEWYFYVFEATLMLLNSLIWNIWNPARYLPADRNVYLAEDGITELKRQGEMESGVSRYRKVLKAGMAIFTFGLSDMFYRKKGENGSVKEFSLTSRDLS